MISKYQCEICASIYSDEANARRCEARGDASIIKDGMECVGYVEDEYGESKYVIGVLAGVRTSGHIIREAQIVTPYGTTKPLNVGFVKARVAMAKMLRFLGVTEVPNEAFQPTAEVGHESTRCA